MGKLSIGVLAASTDDSDLKVKSNFLSFSKNSGFWHIFSNKKRVATYTYCTYGGESTTSSLEFVDAPSIAPGNFIKSCKLVIVCSRSTTLDRNAEYIEYLRGKDTVLWNSEKDYINVLKAIGDLI